MFSKWRRKAPKVSIRVCNTKVDEDDFMYIAHYYGVCRAQKSIPWRENQEGPWKMVRVAGSLPNQLTCVPRGGACNCGACLLYIEKHSRPILLDQDTEDVPKRTHLVAGTAGNDIAFQSPVVQGDAATQSQIPEFDVANVLTETNQHDAAAEDDIEARRDVDLGNFQKCSAPLRGDYLGSRVDRQDSVTVVRPR